MNHRSKPNRGVLGTALASVVALAVTAGSVYAQPKGASSPTVRVQTVAEAGGEFTLRLVSYRDLPFRTVVRQQYDFSCGSASLATLLRFQYDIDVGEADIFKSMYAVGDQKKIQRVGFSLLDMKNYLDRRGFISDGYKAPLALLAKTGTPAIVVISVGRYRHFVVVKGVRGGYVLVGDPALGIRAFRQDEFAKVWDGTFFVIHGGAPISAVFNSAKEWGQVPPLPFSYSLQQEQSMSELTRNLPINFQILPVVQLAGAGS